jgi:cob(I)alamin adenosyltransferase
MTTDEGGSFRVTMRHLWEEQQEMKRLLQKVSDQLPNVAMKLEVHERETHKILTDHESRIRQLEQNCGRFLGLSR